MTFFLSSQLHELWRLFLGKELRFYLSQKCVISEENMGKSSLPENNIALTIYTLVNTEFW